MYTRYIYSGYILHIDFRVEVVGSRSVGFRVQSWHRSAGTCCSLQPYRLDPQAPALSPQPSTPSA